MVTSPSTRKTVGRIPVLFEARRGRGLKQESHEALGESQGKVS